MGYSWYKNFIQYFFFKENFIKFFSHFLLLIFLIWIVDFLSVQYTEDKFGVVVISREIESKKAKKWQVTHWIQRKT